MSRVAVFPGSFDPMTMAHLDVARRAATLFDRLIIGVLHNPKKAIPGNKMVFNGVQNNADLADLLAYLRTLSDNPVPLPK